MTPTTTDYEARELTLLQAQLSALSARPLAERQDARQQWASALTDDLDTVLRTIDWIVAGNYGFGAYRLSRDVLTNPGQRNVRAFLAQLAAGLEWGCPGDFARQSYVKLPAYQQAVVDAAIDALIVELADTLAEQD